MPRQEGLVAGRCGQRAGLDVQVAPACLGVDRGTRGLPPGAQEVVTQETNQKQTEQRPEAISLFPLPTQAAAGWGR